MQTLWVRRIKRWSGCTLQQLDRLGQRTYRFLDTPARFALDFLLVALVGKTGQLDRLGQRFLPLLQNPPSTLISKPHALISEPQPSTLKLEP